MNRIVALAETASASCSYSDVPTGAIPLSAFYGNGFDQRVVRFCFAKKEETLRTALDRLARL